MTDRHHTIVRVFLKEGNQITNVFANMISHSHNLFFYAIFENLEYFHKI